MSSLTTDLTTAEIESHIAHWTAEYRTRSDEDARESADLARWRWIEIWLDRQAS